ncbi:MAG TPA: nucleotidyl transferase AbiEii/AbiGii toxin family protein [Sedimentisphaerales bacterium]|nr:nucleotidyl transferase AbiEii/AbiGii toxin family protein [Sedimentisphaerales bacterium]
MDRRLIEQLADLAESFNRIGLKPVICGGLGLYLCFHKAEGQARQMIRATTDIDLMLTRTQVLKEAERRAIAATITDGLGYIVREGCEYYQFIKEPDQDLDILSPPVEGLEVDNFRIKIVKSKLHGHITPEACFIEEGLRTVSLREFLPDEEQRHGLEVQVPSPTNLLLLKLFAFNDRDEGQRQDSERAQAHAWDIYVIIMLATSRDDYLEGQDFLSRHEDSDIIQNARSIVGSKFNAVEQAGWRRVLESSDFYPGLNRREKEARLDEAMRRLLRWFDISRAGSKPEII